MKEIDGILVIDDDEVVRDSCFHILERGARTIKTAEDGMKGLEILAREHFDAVILDLKMPGMSGMEVLKRISKKYPDVAVIVMTGYATIDLAVEAMKLGAYDFVTKPFSSESLRRIVKAAIDQRRLKSGDAALKAPLRTDIKGEALIGHSRPIREIKALIEKVAPTDTTVLITGESGTGKEVIARHIHSMSRRRNRVFVAVDCGALVETLFESELFGHVKGSFTGADSTKYGRFEMADGGTLFLDEIATISLNIQAKLLRAIQEREICRVGSSQPVSLDVRIIAATSRDLKSAVRRGEFRDDLFYRLCVVWMHVPPLRERKEDIGDFARYFMKKFSERRRKDVRHISSGAMQALLQYDWPGNVRELENTIERAVVLTEDDTIKPADLFYYGFPVETNGRERPDTLDSSDRPLPANLKEVEKELIARTLRRYHGYKGAAAKALGMDRKTLYRKLKRYRSDRNIQ